MFSSLCNRWPTVLITYHHGEGRLSLASQHLVTLGNRPEFPQIICWLKRKWNSNQNLQLSRRVTLRMNINNLSSWPSKGFLIKEGIPYLGSQPPNRLQAISSLNFLKLTPAKSIQGFRRKQSCGKSCPAWSINMHIKELNKLICSVPFTNFSSDICIHTPK